MSTIIRRAYARAGLLGNPSDGYYGKTLSIALANFCATVQLRSADGISFNPNPTDVGPFSSLGDLSKEVSLTGYAGGIPLLKAACKVFYQYCQANNIAISEEGFQASYASNIPRQVGMAGSSAIVVAMLKALCSFYNVTIDPNLLPTLALEAETKELGITAGLQDRVIQTWQGCVLMDFERDHQEQNGFGKYARVDEQLIPQLYVAYKTSLGKVSGKVLTPLRTRFEQGDPTTLRVLHELAALPEHGAKAFADGDMQKFAMLLNRNFDLRTEIMNITDANMELVQQARSFGASATFSGSGGAIVGTLPSGADVTTFTNHMRIIGAETQLVQIASPDLI